MAEKDKKGGSWPSLPAVQPKGNVSQSDIDKKLAQSAANAGAAKPQRDSSQYAQVVGESSMPGQPSQMTDGTRAMRILLWNLRTTTKDPNQLQKLEALMSKVGTPGLETQEMLAVKQPGEEVKNTRAPYVITQNDLNLLMNMIDQRGYFMSKEDYTTVVQEVNSLTQTLAAKDAEITRLGQLQDTRDTRVIGRKPSKLWGLVKLLFAVGTAMAAGKGIYELSKYKDPEIVTIDINGDGYPDQKITYREVPWLKKRYGTDKVVYGQPDGTLKTEEEVIESTLKPIRQELETQLSSLKSEVDSRAQRIKSHYQDRMNQAAEEKRKFLRDASSSRRR
jgi:hypothetical protein